MEEKYTCCFCKKEFIGWGNNPYPANKDENAKCCNDCNAEFVIPARLEALFKKEND